MFGAFHSAADGELPKQADKLPRIPPLCLGTIRETPDTGPANSGSAGTEGYSHARPVLLPMVFIVPPFTPTFHCQLLLVSVPFGTRSERAFVSIQLPFFVLIEIVDARDSRMKTVDRFILIDFISLCHSLCKAVQLWCDGQQMVNVQQTSIVGKTIQNKAVSVISSARLHF